MWNMLAASACAENNARHGVQFLAGTSSQLLAGGAFTRDDSKTMQGDPRGRFIAGRNGLSRL
jgi:hypothetical protein